MKTYKDFESTLHPIATIATQKTKYTNDFSKEFEYIKKLEYASVQEKRDKENKDKKSEDLRNLGFANTMVRTSVDDYVVHKKPLQNLKNFFTEALNDYTKNVLYSDEKLVIVNSWVSKSEQGDATEPHKHLSIVNGVFYFNVPDDKTPLVFDTYNCLNERYDVVNKVNTGDLILFPNELSHWVPSNPNKEVRYCLAFSTIAEEEYNRMKEIVKSHKTK